MLSLSLAVSGSGITRASLAYAAESSKKDKQRLYETDLPFDVSADNALAFDPLGDYALYGRLTELDGKLWYFPVHVAPSMQAGKHESTYLELRAFDLRDNKWLDEETTELPCGRLADISVCTYAGKLWVAGIETLDIDGVTAYKTDGTVHILSFDPATDTWEEHSTKGIFTWVGDYQNIYADADGLKVLSFNIIYPYDPATGLSSEPLLRLEGNTTNTQIVTHNNDVYIYDTDDSKLQILTNDPQSDGKLLVDVELPKPFEEPVDPKKEKEQKQNAKTPEAASLAAASKLDAEKEYRHASMVAGDEALYLVGYTDKKETADTWAISYDTDDITITPLEKHVTTSRPLQTSAAFVDGKIYAMATGQASKDSNVFRATQAEGKGADEATREGEGEGQGDEQTTPWKVTFESNGGDTVEAQDVEERAYATRPEDPKRDNFTFLGWFSDEGLTTEFDFDNTPVTDNLVLYAKWEEIPEPKQQFTVTFRDFVGSDTKVTVMEGDAVDQPADPTREGYTFSGWFTDAALTQAYDFTQPVTSSLTLRAKWVRIRHTVTFNAAGGSTVKNQTVAYGNTATQPDDPTRKGYNFTGWYTDAAGKNAFDFSTAIKGDLTLYAGWEAEKYMVTFRSFVDDDVKKSVENGKTIKKPADPTRKGYTFDGWFTDAALTKAYDFSKPVTSNLLLRAKWTKKSSVDGTYTVSFRTFVGPDNKVDVTENDKVAKPADPTRAGYTFGGWYSDAALTKEYDFNQPVTKDLILRAKWTKTSSEPEGTTHTVTFNSLGGSEVATQKVADGKKATRPVAPTREGYSFVGWFTDEALTQSYNFSTPVTEDITLRAKWVKRSSNGQATQRTINTTTSSPSSSSSSRSTTTSSTTATKSDLAKTGDDGVPWQASVSFTLGTALTTFGILMRKRFRLG